MSTTFWNFVNDVSNIRRAGAGQEMCRFVIGQRLEAHIFSEMKHVDDTGTNGHQIIVVVVFTACTEVELTASEYRNSRPEPKGVGTATFTATAVPQL